MSQQVNVARSLNFTDQANIASNVQGNMLEAKKHFSDHFTGDTLSTDLWSATVGGSSDAIAIEEISGGSCLMTLGQVDDDSSHLAGAIIWKGTKNPVIEGRITIDDVSGTGLFFGLSDAKSEANGSIAIHYPANSLTTVATDAVGFVCDADHTSSLLMCCGVYGNTDATAVSTGITWADLETKTLRIRVATGTAFFYVDGVLKASIPTAVTSTVLLCASLHGITRANDLGNLIHLSRVDCWQDED